MTLNSERCALITGASSGIGKATALAFAEAGIHLALVSRSQPQLEAVAETARQFGVKVQIYPIDLSVVAEVRSQIEVIATSSPLDILINNAGMGYTGSLMEMSLTDWQRVIDLNVTSVLQCIQGVLPEMRKRKQGTIINVASIAAHQAFPNWGAYCASKFGLLAFSRTLAEEVRGDGIRVTALCPGSVDTALWDSEHVKADFDRSAMLSADSVARLVVWAATLPSEAVLEEATLMPSRGAF